MKPCQTDKLLSETQILHLKIKLNLITTTLRVILNHFEVKHLWNQMQIELIVHKKETEFSFSK